MSLKSLKDAIFEYVKTNVKEGQEFYVADLLNVFGPCGVGFTAFYVVWHNYSSSAVRSAWEKAYECLKADNQIRCAGRDWTKPRGPLKFVKCKSTQKPTVIPTLEMAIEEYIRKEVKGSFSRNTIIHIFRSGCTILGTFWRNRDNLKIKAVWIKVIQKLIDEGVITKGYPVGTDDTWYDKIEKLPAAKPATLADAIAEYVREELGEGETFIIGGTGGRIIQAFCSSSEGYSAFGKVWRWYSTFQVKEASRVAADILIKERLIIKGQGPYYYIKSSTQDGAIASTKSTLEDVIYNYVQYEIPRNSFWSVQDLSLFYNGRGYVFNNQIWKTTYTQLCISWKRAKDRLVHDGLISKEHCVQIREWYRTALITSQPEEANMAVLKDTFQEPDALEMVIKIFEGDTTNDPFLKALDNDKSREFLKDFLVQNLTSLQNILTLLQKFETSKSFVEFFKKEKKNF